MARCDFANARVRARGTRLLGARGLRELLWRASFETRMVILRQSIHARAVEPGDPWLVARALAGGVPEETRRIERYLEGKRPRTLFRALTWFDDAAALKTILRGLARGQAAAGITALVEPTLDLPWEALVELANQAGADGVVETLRRRASRFAEPLAAALPGWRRDNDLSHLDGALDGAALAAAAAAARGHDEDSGVVRRAIERRVEANQRANGVKLNGPGEGATPWSVDRGLERRELAVLRREARLRPLSLAVPLHHLAELRAEVRLIRLILLGESGPDAGELIALLEAA